MSFGQKTWQALPACEKASYLITSGHLADCSFIVGSDPDDIKTFPSHKLLLTCVSPVFEAMFYSDFKESQSPTEIRLEDVEPLEFEKFLEFAYTNNAAKLETIETELLVLLAGLGHKYIVTDLENACIDILKQRMLNFSSGSNERVRSFNNLLRVDDLFLIFTYAKRMNHGELLKVNIQTIQNVSTEIVFCSKLNSLDIDYFKDFLETLKDIVSEAIRFRMIESYIRINKLIERKRALCRVKNKTLDELVESDKKKSDTSVNEIEGKNTSDLDVVASLLNVINYTKMTAEEFCIGPGMSNFFNPKIKYELLSKITLQATKTTMKPW